MANSEPVSFTPTTNLVFLLCALMYIVQCNMIYLVEVLDSNSSLSDSPSTPTNRTGHFTSAVCSIPVLLSHDHCSFLDRGQLSLWKCCHGLLATPLIVSASNIGLFNPPSRYYKSKPITFIFNLKNLRMEAKFEYAELGYHKFPCAVNTVCLPSGHVERWP